MITTTKEQSARLLKCGVSAESADMSWHGNTLETFPQLTYDMWLLTPAWSLSALLTKVLPHNISVDKYKYKGATEYEVGCYFMGHRDKKAFNAPDPIEACVQLIEWLTENNYKLNER